MSNRDPDETRAPVANGPGAGTNADPWQTVASNNSGTLPPPEIPERIGNYELLGEIARGGMGVVFRAKHTTLQRLAAVKMILSGGLASDLELKRFLTEAEAVATLDHPGIVSIYEIGRHEGRPFFAMALIEGGSLASRLAKAPLPAREAAQIIAETADAIEYAHSRGVLHRDLKPANILLDGDGRPKVTDFGLARRTDSEDDLTRTGQILGTPGFMSPEQALGRGKHVGPACDIYSLGAVLYAALTGRPPFQAATALETVQQVVEEQPLPPRLLNSAIPRDLEKICLKCLAKEPSQRYLKASDLAADLRRHLNGEPVSIASLGVVDRLFAELHRSRDDAAVKDWDRILTSFAVIVLLAELGIFGVMWSGVQPRAALCISFRLLQYLGMAIVLWSFRRSWMGAASSVSRTLLSTWVGFIIACHAAFAVETLGALSSATRDPALRSYSQHALLSGLMWFGLGGAYWGYFYCFGLAFFAASMGMAYWPELAPLLFGGLWFLCLFATSCRLNWLKRTAK